MLRRHDSVFVFPYPSCGETFRFPAMFACCSGELKARGIDSAVVELYLDASVPGGVQGALASLGDFLSDCSPRVVVLSDVFEPALFLSVRASCDAVVVCTDGVDSTPPGQVDFTLDRFETNPPALVELVQALVRGDAVDGIPNVRAQGGTFAAGIEPCAAVPMFSVPPDYGFVQIPEGTKRPSERLSVYVNPGCPWSKDVADNPVFEGVDLTGAGLALRGCSFCLQDGRYSGLDAAGTVDRIALELESWLKLHPGCGDVVVWDESPWRFLVPLVERVAAIAKTPIAVCFHARADEIVRRAEVIEAACNAARRNPGAGVSLAVTLIGFENYSAAELSRMNKGTSPDDVRGAVETCRRIADAWPDVFEFDRFKASSFILFTPWTTRVDLEENIRGFNRDNILEFSTGMALTRLRMYPGLPIFRLAVRDGLVSAEAFDTEMDSARRFGYSTDVPWRFSDPAIEQVYRLYLELYPLVDRHEQVDLLDWVVRTVFDGDGGTFTPGTVAELFTRLSAAIDLMNGRANHRESSGTHGDSAGRCKTLEITLSGAGVPGPGRAPDLSGDPSPGRLAVRIARYGADASMIHVIGREPGRSPVLLRSVYLARQSGIPGAAVRTDGTIFAHPAMLARAIKAGITDIEFRVFGAGADAWTAVTGDPGTFDTFRAAAALVGASSSVVNSRALVELGLVKPYDIGAVVDMVAASGLRGISWEAPVAFLPESNLSNFVEALESAASGLVNRRRELP